MDAAEPGAVGGIPNVAGVAAAIAGLVGEHGDPCEAGVQDHEEHEDHEAPQLALAEVHGSALVFGHCASISLERSGSIRTR